MMRNFNTDDDDTGGNEWLNTYSDMVTLLLCFFVLLYSMSVINEEKFKQAIGSFNEIGIFGESGSMNTDVGDSISSLDTYNAIDVTKQMDDIYKEVVAIIKSGGLQNDIGVEMDQGGVVIRFKDDYLFDTGKADLKPNVKTSLYKMANVLRKYNRTIRVEGHTDNVPIHNSEFKSNWELSTARAISVVRYFTSELPENKRFSPDKFQVTGYGEYHPIAPNDTEANRQKNRRIEIIVLGESK